MKLSDKQKGVLFIIISAFCFAFMNCFVRMAGDLPTIQKSFFRNLVAAIVAFAVLCRSKIGLSYRLKDIPLLFLRSAAGTIGILGNFYALDRMNLADASMLNKMSPFFTVVFSFIILKEKPKMVQIAGVIFAFLGSLFIIKPSMNFTAFMPAAIAFIGGMSAGFAYTLVRALGERGVKGPLIVFFFSMFSCLVVLPYIVMHYQPMTAKQLIILIMAGVAATGGQFGITTAYSYAPAKEISVFDYTQIIFATILGFILFDQVPDVYSFIGYAIICAVAIAMFLYNKKEETKNENV